MTPSDSPTRTMTGAPSERGIGNYRLSRRVPSLSGDSTRGLIFLTRGTWILRVACGLWTELACSISVRRLDPEEPVREAVLEELVEVAVVRA